MKNPWSPEADKFREHIEGVTGTLLQPTNFVGVLQRIIETRSSACVDENCINGNKSGQFPAAIIGLVHQGKQESVYRKLRESGAVDLDAYIHLYCGYLFTYLDLVTLEQQTEYIDIMKSTIEKDAKRRYNIHVNFLHGGNHGTAEPHMNEK